MTKKIQFHSTEEVEEFVRIANKCEFDIDVRYGSICLDGKSLVGLMSIELGRELTVFHTGTNPVFEQIISKYQKIV